MNTDEHGFLIVLLPVPVPVLERLRLRGRGRGGFTLPADAARLVQVAGRHFTDDLVNDADADEIFPHFAGGARKDFMAIRQRDPEPGVGEHLPDAVGVFNRLFLGHS
jgi:hypothetical protein